MDESDDRALFGPDSLPLLQRAAEETAWLIARDYPRAKVVAFVAEHHGLVPRQILAMERGVCSDAQYKRRVLREIETEEVPRRPLLVDAVSLLQTVDALARGAPVVRTLEGTVRGLDEHTASADEASFARIAEALRALRPSKSRWLLDEGSPESASIAQRVQASASRFAGTTEVKMVRDAKKALSTSGRVVSSDPDVLDACSSWFNLAGWIADRTPTAWILRLQ